MEKNGKIGKKKKRKEKKNKKNIKIAEIHAYGGNIILVTTCDVLSFASVYPDSFQLSPHLCVFVGHSVYCARSVSCARDCVFLTRDMACTTAQEISRVPHPTW